jgi:asparagine synthase (glutamine-hydrolysing)
VRAAVLGPRLSDTGWFDARYLRHLVEAHDAGARDYSTPLWSLLMFEAFLRNVCDTGRTGGGNASIVAAEAA